MTGSTSSWSRHPGTIVGGGRPDPTFNRIALNIVKAVKQFDAVNPNHSLPNVLVFVNHDDNSSYRDLCETLTGRIRADSGEVYAYMTHISDGLLGDKRKRIDLYVWIYDYRDLRRIGGWLMANTVPEHTHHNPGCLGILTGRSHPQHKSQDC
jgi:hypothetical protein